MAKPATSYHSNEEALARQLDHARRHFLSDFGRSNLTGEAIAHDMAALRRTLQRLETGTGIEPPQTAEEKAELEQELGALHYQLKVAGESFQWQEQNTRGFRKAWARQEHLALREIYYAINQALLAAEDRTSHYAAERATAARP